MMEKHHRDTESTEERRGSPNEHRFVDAETRLRMILNPYSSVRPHLSANSSRYFSFSCLGVFASWRDFFFLWFLFILPTFAFAGGGPEGVLLVVNPLSHASMTIANHYVRLRAIPPDNVFYLPWPPEQQTTDVDTFRKRILLPVLLNLRSRGMDATIDYIVYSSDFPWGITLESDRKKFMAEAQQEEARLGGTAENTLPNEKDTAKLQWPQTYTPVGSINGLTCLWQAVASREATYFDPQSNRYMRPPEEQQRESSSRGFRAHSTVLSPVATWWRRADGAIFCR